MTGNLLLRARRFEPSKDITIYIVQEQSSRFSRNHEADFSEYPEYLEEFAFRYLY